MRSTLRNILLVCGVFIGLQACSHVKEDTFEVELTTDNEPHTVELWFRDRNASGGFKFAYALKFPQSYYVFRDNHHAVQQTTIGLLFNAKTFGALTEFIYARTGLKEPLEVPPGSELRLKKAVFGPFRDLKMLVTIRAPAITTKLALERARQKYKAIYEFDGEKRGISYYKYSRPSDNPASDQIDVLGFAIANPNMQFHCPYRTVFCSVEFPFRNSTVTMFIPPDAVSDMQATSQKVAKLLEQHLK